MMIWLVGLPAFGVGIAAAAYLLRRHSRLVWKVFLAFDGVLAPGMDQLPPDKQAYAKSHYFNTVLELHTYLTRR